MITEKVVAAFSSGADETLSRARASVVLQTVYGSILPWMEMKRLGELVELGEPGSRISFSEFEKLVMPSVEAGRFVSSHNASLGPMQRAREGVRSTTRLSEQTKKVAVKSAKDIYRAIVSILATSLYVL